MPSRLDQKKSGGKPEGGERKRLPWLWGERKTLLRKKKDYFREEE